MRNIYPYLEREALGQFTIDQFILLVQELLQINKLPNVSIQLITKIRSFVINDRKFRNKNRNNSVKVPNDCLRSGQFFSKRKHLTIA